jgi:tyrosyl-tRNA synthetase
MAEYYRLLLGRESPAGPSGNGSGPRAAKRALARALVSWLHSPQDAADAEAQFDRVFVERGEPAEIEEGTFAASDGALHLPGLIAELFGLSRAEARRLIDQGAVKLGEQVLAPGSYDVPAAGADGQVLRVGKRRFRRLRAE